MKKKRSPNLTRKVNPGNGPASTESTGSGNNIGTMINSSRQSTPPSSQSISVNAIHPQSSGPIQPSTHRLGSNNNCILEDHEQQTEESILSPQDQSGQFYLLLY
jgi:hypothetical protein